MISSLAPCSLCFHSLSILGAPWNSRTRPGAAENHRRTPQLTLGGGGALRHRSLLHAGEGDADGHRHSLMKDTLSNCMPNRFTCQSTDRMIAAGYGRSCSNVTDRPTTSQRRRRPETATRRSGMEKNGQRPVMAGCSPWRTPSVEFPASVCCPNTPGAGRDPERTVNVRLLLCPQFAQSRHQQRRAQSCCRQRFAAECAYYAHLAQETELACPLA